MKRETGFTDNVSPPLGMNVHEAERGRGAIDRDRQFATVLDQHFGSCFEGRQPKNLLVGKYHALQRAIATDALARVSS